LNFIANSPMQRLSSCWKTIVSPSVLNSSLALIDQGIVSGTRFSISLLLARYVIPTEYGMFVLAYAFLIFFSYIQTSIIVVPMTVIGAPLKSMDMKKYFTSLGLAQFIFGLTVMLIILITAKISSLFFIDSPLFLTVFFSMAFASFALQGQEFFRRALFTQQRVKDAFLNDFFCCCLQIAGFIVILKWGVLSGSNIFWIYFLASIIAIAYGLFQCRDVISSDLSDFKTYVGKNWNYGKYLILSTFTQYISSQIFIFATAGFLTLAAAGVIGAVRNIFSVLNMATNGIRSFILPYASKKFTNSGLVFLCSLIKKICIVGTAGVIIYCVSILWAPQFILDFLYKGQYKGYSYVVILFAIQSIFAFLNFPSHIGLLILRKMERILYSNLFSSATSIMVGIPLVKYWGLYGACVGMILTQAVLAGTSFYFLAKSMQKYANEKSI